MLSSLAGRLITSPWAFLATGVFDFVAFFALFAYRWVLARVRAALARSLPGTRSRAPGAAV